eukprot:gnl/TRDRNA2_/TRDRNA2_82196_c0_seq1.p1 gnl/TRDRNA2_/TRDRNA2_82196_c0~~gnl/TRDRNA2_/TRDRNA2_82196_c0_seq1.p1  ORF type:complete len:359 (-),score=39.71 gnl/TRDRNA2_/TRDRNA2_82196_c0_seq1:53-1129(-)
MTPGGKDDPATWGVTLSTARLNGITQRWADTAKNDADRRRPTILFMHGWPESWFSYRHQLMAAHAAGYRGIAPDMRGYGGSSSPQEMANYNVYSLAGDMLALLQHLGVSKAALVGHDHGAAFGWKLCLLHPDVFVCYMALSVPYFGRASSPPLESMRKVYGDERKPEDNPRFFYILHHQLASAAANYGRDTEAVFRLMYGSMADAGEAPIKSDRLYVDGQAEGFVRRAPQPKSLQPWISKEEVDYYVAEFKRVGWEGGLNWYRVMDIDWHATPQLHKRKVTQPVMFLAGGNDNVIKMSGGEESVRRYLPEICEQKPTIKIIDGAGHWIQQEKVKEVNEAMLAFVGEHRAKLSAVRSRL